MAVRSDFFLHFLYAPVLPKCKPKGAAAPSIFLGVGAAAASVRASVLREVPSNENSFTEIEDPMCIQSITEIEEPSLAMP